MCSVWTASFCCRWANRQTLHLKDIWDKHRASLEIEIESRLKGGNAKTKEKWENKIF